MYLLQIKLYKYYTDRTELMQIFATNSVFRLKVKIMKCVCSPILSTKSWWYDKL